MSNVSTKKLDELFSNFSSADALVKEPEKKSFVDENIYDPKPKDSTDGTYSAVIRFLPHIYQDNRATYFAKASAWLKEYNGTKSIPVDTPYQGKSQWNDCPIKKAIYNLYKKGKDGDVISMEKSRALDTVRLNYYSLVQIVRDKVHPEYENKIFIYRFNETIKKKIEKCLNGSEFETGENCYDIVKPAPLFEIKLANTQKTINGKQCNVPTYDDCNFITKTSNFLFEDGNEVDMKDEKSREKMYEIIKEKSTLINTYRFQPWSEETRTKVNEILSTYFVDAPNISNVKNSVIETVNVESNKPSQLTENNSEQKDILDEILGDEDLF